MEDIGLIINNSHCFDEENYSLIINKINQINDLEKEKQNIINELIDIITKNKHKFRNNNNLECYNLIISKLIKNLQNIKHSKTEECIPEYLELIETIGGYKSLEKSNYKNIIIENNPVLGYCFGDNKFIELQTEPILGEYDKNKTLNEIKFLLKIINDSGNKKNKIIICLAIYDKIFKNYKLVIEQKIFKETVKNKILEFLTDGTIVDINNFLNEKGYKSNPFEIWKNKLDEI
jgi:hypothetical protein